MEKVSERIPTGNNYPIKMSTIYPGIWIEVHNDFEFSQALDNKPDAARSRLVRKYFPEATYEEEQKIIRTLELTGKDPSELSLIERYADEEHYKNKVKECIGKLFNSIMKIPDIISIPEEISTDKRNEIQNHLAEIKHSKHMIHEGIKNLNLHFTETNRAVSSIYSYGRQVEKLSQTDIGMWAMLDSFRVASQFGTVAVQDFYLIQKILIENDIKNKEFDAMIDTLSEIKNITIAGFTDAAKARTTIATANTAEHEKMYTQGKYIVNKVECVPAIVHENQTEEGKAALQTNGMLKAINATHDEMKVFQTWVNDGKTTRSQAKVSEITGFNKSRVRRLAISFNVKAGRDWIQWQRNAQRDDTNKARNSVHN